MRSRDQNLSMQLFAEAEKKFAQHLNIEGNERIIFSGKFGHGKTTFLREFFSKDNQTINFKNEKFNIISLYPVNYSIASNEDIFKYIKYDIILEMLNKGYQVEETLISEIDTLPNYLYLQGYKILPLIISMIPKVGKDLKESLEQCSQLINGFKKYHKEKEEKANETNQLITYLNDLEVKEGSIFEDNIISNLIESILKSNKSDGNPENILLIDDLDRIDPEHIFRILNIFAAHFDRNNKRTQNKFGFDKIIIVCDIENIRNIFKAKYGIDTDFNGYIDKFYSYEIFNYSIRDAVVTYAIDKIHAAPLLYDNGSRLKPNDESWAKTKTFNSDHFFIDIIKILFDNKEIDLRNIIKWDTMGVTYNDMAFFKYLNFPTGINTEEYPIIFFIKLLCKIKGSAESLKSSLNKVSTHKSLPIERLKSHLAKLVFLNTLPDHKGKKDTGHSYYYEIMDYKVYLRVNGEGKINIDHVHTEPQRFDDSHLFWLLGKSVDFLVSQNLL